jgi:hypothetical protein
MIRRHIITLILLSICLVGVALFLRWWRAGQRSALLELPAAERVALYQRTIENLRSVCAPSRPSGLDSFCDEQAELVLDFDDCDAECRKLALAHHGIPTR